MRVAAEIVLTSEQKSELERLTRGRRTEARLVLRARIVLLAADGHTDLEIAERLGLVPRPAARWRLPFLQGGAAGFGAAAPPPCRNPGHLSLAAPAVDEAARAPEPPSRRA